VTLKEKSSKNFKINQDPVHQIAEILALMEETHRTKEWLLNQVKKEKMKGKVKASMNSYQILTSCPPEFVSKVLHVLKGGDIDDLGDIETLTKTYHWFFCDIVAGSNPNLVTKEQVRKIIVLNELIARTETFRASDPDGTVILPTGDGMAIGFDDSPEKTIAINSSTAQGPLKI